MLTWLGVPGEPQDWDPLGFVVEGSDLRIGSVAVSVGHEPLSWGFDRLHDDPVQLGVPTRKVAPDGRPTAVHPNRIVRIDHVVFTVPNLDDAIVSIGSVLGMQPRRRLRPRGPDSREMAFYRAGEAVLEVVQGDGGPRLWGLALRSTDLDRTVQVVTTQGGRVGEPRPAVQGGRIATIHDAPLPLAVMGT